MTLPVLWLDWWEGHEPAVMWDQHQVRCLFAEHDPLNYKLDIHDTPAGVTAAAVIVPGRFAAGDEAAVTDLIAHLDRVLLIVTSDEESAFEYEQVTHPNMRRWVQTPKIGRGPVDLHLGCGPPPETDDLLEALFAEHGPALVGDRPYRWVYDGQINHPRRVEMKAATAGLPGPLARDHNLWTVTPGFAQGRPRTEYLARLASARIAFCPAGPYTPDTFRLWEALAAHTLPLTGAISPADPDDAGYWQRLVGADPPWPLIHDWTHLQGHLADAVAAWPENLNRAVAWWLTYKQRLRHTTADAVAWLADTPTPYPGGPVTALVATSPIASNPDTDMVETTMASVRHHLPDADVILMIDGPRPDLPDDRRAAYAEYTRRLLWLADHCWRRVTPLLFPGWRHQVAMTAEALDRVRTPVVLFMEHDTPLEVADDLPLDLTALAAPIMAGAADVIRLAHESEILPVHRYLMLDRKPRTMHGVPLTRTWQWSQRPHLAATAYYRERVGQINGPEARCFIEDAMVGICERTWLSDQETGWYRNRVAIYTPRGNIRRSYHLDGRGEEPKGPQRFDYPTDEPPPGAPQPRWIPG
jgi:hypothetical protein